MQKHHLSNARILQWASLIGVLVGLSFSTLSNAAVEQSTQKGIYESVTLHEREQHLIETANELEGQFLRRGFRYRDVTLGDRLSRITEKIAPQLTDPYIDYRVFILRDPSPNAFALPDGQIYVHTGMLARLENESQLAALLAHEANHVAGHHGILAYRLIRKKAITSMVVGSILGGFGGDFGSVIAGVVDVGLAASIFGYSRTLEEEADRRAVQLLRNGGYDVNELPSIFEILNQDPEGESPRIRTKWSTHPQLEERATYLREMIEGLPEEDRTKVAIGKNDFRQFVLPIALMTVQDYIRADYPRTALFVARQLTKEHPNNPRAFIALGNAWHALGARSELSPDRPLTDKEKKESVAARAVLTRAERKAKQLQSQEGYANLAHNMKSAKQAYLAALEIDHAIPEAYRGLGEAYYALHRDKQAARAYMRYLKMQPGAPDKLLILEKLKTLLAEIKRGIPDEEHDLE